MLYYTQYSQQLDVKQSRVLDWNNYLRRDKTSAIWKTQVLPLAVNHCICAQHLNTSPKPVLMTYLLFAEEHTFLMSGRLTPSRPSYTMSYITMRRNENRISWISNNSRLIFRCCFWFAVFFFTKGILWLKEYGHRCSILKQNDLYYFRWANCMVHVTVKPIVSSTPPQNINFLSVSSSSCPSCISLLPTSAPQALISSCLTHSKLIYLTTSGNKKSIFFQISFLQF